MVIVPVILSVVFAGFHSSCGCSCVSDYLFMDNGCHIWNNICSFWRQQLSVKRTLGSLFVEGCIQWSLRLAMPKVSKFNSTWNHPCWFFHSHPKRCSFLRSPPCEQRSYHFPFLYRLGLYFSFLTTRSPRQFHIFLTWEMPPEQKCNSISFYLQGFPICVLSLQFFTMFSGHLFI